LEPDARLLALLNSYNLDERQKGVLALAEMQGSGSWKPGPVRPWMNLHAHTFHSFNSNGWSPSRLVYEACQHGLEMIGTVDFDVMDAIPEVLEAGDLLHMKTVAGLESRVFIPEYASKVINSPGEPGIAYFMLTGCTGLPEEGSTAHKTLTSLKDIAQNRNRVMVARLNDFLGEVQIDYETDLLPVTPSGNPTERHLVEAYDKKARTVFSGNPQSWISFWSDKFGMGEDKVAALIAQPVPFQETLRSRLMKRGGLGYIEPEPARFPTVDAVIELGEAIGALPTVAWLDGTSEGESEPSRMLSLFVEKGIAALNIIPDRNWNIKDPAEKAVKIARLKEVVEVARDLDLPLCIGTEMNKAGQPFVDRFDAPELEPFVEDFRKGARTLWGHTLLSRALEFGWSSKIAEKHFGSSRSARFDFYHAVGCRFEPGKEARERVAGLKPEPGVILDSCGAGGKL
jgi:hypothetical protein